MSSINTHSDVHGDSESRVYLAERFRRGDWGGEMDGLVNREWFKLRRR